MSIPTPYPRFVGEILWTWIFCCLMVGIAQSQTCDRLVGSPANQVILGDDQSQFFPQNRNCIDNIVPPRCIGGSILRYVDPVDPNQLTRYACLASPEHGQDLPLLVHFHGSHTPTVDVSFSGFFGAPPRTDLLSQVTSASLAPDTVGYVLLMPQGRCTTAPPPPDSDGDGMHHDAWFKDSQNNLDVRAAQAFIQQVFDRTSLDENRSPIPFPAGFPTVNRKRVYLMGHSNGAFFAHMLGLMFPDQFAAMATAAGADPFARGPCSVPLPTVHRKIPLLSVHATCDPVVLCDCFDCSEQTSTAEKWVKVLAQLGWGTHILEDVITDNSHVQLLASCLFSSSSRQKLCPSSAHEFPNPQLKLMLDFLGRYALP